MRTRGMLPALVSLVTLVSLVACGGTNGAQSESLRTRIEATGKLTVGIAMDQPGLGLKRADGKFVGFDVDIARFIAKELGVDAKNITWKEAPPTQRETLLLHRQVDFVVDAYSITPARQQIVSFVGPYFLAGQDLLVRVSDPSITGPETLDGHILCSVKGSTSAQQVRDKYAQGTTLLEYDRFSECVSALLSGIVDAVTTDDVVLAGFAAQNPEIVRLVGKPFTKERYGIGVNPHDGDGRAAIAEALQKMIDSGAWRRSFQDNLGPSDYPIPEPPRLTER